jgi:hypothetical protein
MVVEHVNLDVGVHMVSNIKKIISLTFSCFLFITTTYAQDNTCKDVNLWPQMWKVRDQGNTGTCYAHAAAYAVDYAFGKKFRPNDPWRVSAFDLAIRAGILLRIRSGLRPVQFDPSVGIANYLPGIDGGSGKLAIHAGIEGGFCDYKKLANDNPIKMTDIALLSNTLFNAFNPDKKWHEYSKYLRTAKTFAERQKLINSLADIYRPIIAAGHLNTDTGVSTLVAEKLTNQCSNYLIKAGVEQSSAQNKCNMIVIGSLNYYKFIFKDASEKELYEVMKLLLSRSNHNYLLFNSKETLTNKAIRDMLEKQYSVTGSNINIISHKVDLFLQYPYYADLVSGMLETRCQQRLKPISTNLINKGFVRTLCKPTDIKDRCDEIYKINNKYFAKHIDSQLDISYPVVVDYKSSGILRSDNVINTRQLNGDHSSTVIGRKFFNGKCHYLVLNTYGDTWQPNDKKYIGVYGVKNGNTKVGGMFYVESDKLVQHIDIVRFLKHRNSSNNSQPLTYSNTSLDSSSQTLQSKEVY